MAPKVDQIIARGDCRRPIRVCLNPRIGLLLFPVLAVERPYETIAKCPSKGYRKAWPS
jgi:hypothetical protein